MWTYKQSTGELMLNGEHVTYGYSGHGEGLNNPTLEHVRDTGPIPVGAYSIGHYYKHASLGPVTMNLTPVNHAARGRDNFRIHGDNSLGNKSASHGCIILQRRTRVFISDHADKQLLVIA